MSLYIGPGTGLELLERNAFTNLFASINTELISVSNHWLTLDQSLAALRGETFASCILETFPNQNFHLGHRPSLLTAPVSDYPNISCMGYDSSPDAEQFDQYDKSVLRLYLEIMVKGTEEDGEETVNRRIKRTTEAAINVLGRDRSFGREFPEMQKPARVTIGDLFVRREEKSRGDIFLWQGSRVEYSIDVFVNPQRIW